MKLIKLSMAVAAISALSACGGGGDEVASSQPTRLLAQASVAPALAPNSASSYGTVVQQLYVAYFGRPADSGGLANFEAALVAAGAPTDVAQLASVYGTNAAVRNLIDGFGTSEESNRLYGGDTAAFVNAVYLSVFNRPPLAPGLKFWTDAIDNGTLTKGNAALSIMAGAMSNQSAQGVKDANAVRNKVAVSVDFTAALALPANMNRYKGPAAAGAARALLAAVDGGTDIVQYKNAVNKTLANLSAGGASPMVEASVGSCYKVNSNTVKYHMGLIYPDGKILVTHHFDIIPLSGFGQTGTYRASFYIEGAADPTLIVDEEVFGNGLKPLVTIGGINTPAQTTITTIDGYRPFDLTLNVERIYTLIKHGKTPLSESTTSEVWGSTLLEIGPLQTAGKYFPLTCKIKERIISSNNRTNPTEIYSIIWFAPGYGIVRLDLFDRAGVLSHEVVSVEIEPN
ncbi:MAG: DUF4214 domain-containing protein [Pseudomonadota bacterium]